MSRIFALFVVFFVSVSSNAEASNWIKIGSETNGDTWYLDDEFTKKTDSYIKVKLLKDLHYQNSNVLSEVEIHEIDCNQPVSKIYHYDSYSQHMANGERRGRTPDTPFSENIAPGSMIYEAQKRYCLHRQKID